MLSNTVQLSISLICISLGVLAAGCHGGLVVRWGFEVIMFNVIITDIEIINYFRMVLYTIRDFADSK